jgi:DNA-binding Xre family transcriptional regulator
VITYEPFWNTLKNSDESTYTLIYNHNLSSSTIDRLRKNKPLSTTTLNDLCRILDCDINDIISYQRSESDQFL